MNAGSESRDERMWGRNVRSDKLEFEMKPVLFCTVPKIICLLEKFSHQSLNTNQESRLKFYPFKNTASQCVSAVNTSDGIGVLQNTQPSLPVMKTPV